MADIIGPYGERALNAWSNPCPYCKDCAWRKEIVQPEMISKMHGAYHIRTALQCIHLCRKWLRQLWFVSVEFFFTIRTLSFISTELYLCNIMTWRFIPQDMVDEWGMGMNGEYISSIHPNGDEWWWMGRARISFIRMGHGILWSLYSFNPPGTYFMKKGPNPPDYL